MITGQTALFGIIGDPVQHSLSPAMHNAAFAALGINGVYVPMRPHSLTEGFFGLKALGFKGVSVTVPFKVEVMHLVDEVDPVAQQIGAVNTLVFTTDGGKPVRCRGLNTDWLGANQALGEEFNLRGSQVLILGAGGAARAVGFGLLHAGATILLTNRTEAKGRLLADQLGCRFVPAGELAAVRADALVNTTSVGMAPNIDEMPIPPECLLRYSVVMDIVYAPLATRLLREASHKGCRTIDGLQMLLHQGAAQFKIWTGMEPPLKVMRTALLNALKSRAH